MYKEASKMKLRFSTNVGQLSVEHLWDLSLVDISNLIKDIKSILKKDNDDELSFLEEDTVVDTENQLRFDILKDVYLSKKSEMKEAQETQKKKAHNEKILMLIAEKEDDSLKDLSIEELKAQLQ